MERFERASLAPVPWKNGGGVTREIVCCPAGADLDSFDWRVSIAQIGADGPFSAFPGVDRVIVLLDGAGVRLRSTSGDVDHRLDQPLAPFAFDGEAAMDCTLLAGESSDFNVMTRRDRVVADVHVIRAPQTLAPSIGGVLLAVNGTWQAEAVSHSVAISLKGSDPMEGVWWDEALLAWKLEPRSDDAALIAVQVSPRDERRLS